MMSNKHYRIAILCRMHAPWQSGLLMARELKKLHHEVLTLPLEPSLLGRAYSDPKSQRDFEGGLIVKISEFKPDFVFVTQGRNFNPAVLWTLKHRGFKLVMWYVDEYGPEQDPYDKVLFTSIKAVYDLILCLTKGIVPLLEGYASKVVWCPKFYDDVYYAPTVPREFKYDICFVGNANRLQSTQRLSWLQTLYTLGYNLKVVGGGYPQQPPFTNQPLYGTEVANVYRQSKVALNFPNDRLEQYELQMSSRVLNCLGCGCFLLTHAIPGLEAMFTSGVHLATYPANDIKMLIACINYYLHNEEKQESIARAGEQKVRENYTTNKVVQLYLKEIEQILRKSERAR